MDKTEVLKLSQLARIALTDAEAEKLSREVGAVLGYVGEVKKIAAAERPLSAADYPLRNVMREDGAGHEPGLYTEALLAAAPKREGDYVQVKNIL
jgi:aspartyl-tRNA(Asn)/glutamyl-tRNA(Gln) amidotransferase subunit C